MAATAVRVFGTPITHGSRTQRAATAKNNQNANGKLKQELQVLQQQKLAAGGQNFGPVSTTICAIYNSSGLPITLNAEHDNWNRGKVVGQYPVTVENGQSVLFEHIGATETLLGGSGRKHVGSVAAIVYNIDEMDSMIVWNNPWKPFGSEEKNTAYCETKEAGSFENCKWDDVKREILKAKTGTNATLGHVSTTVTIDETGNTPLFTAAFYYIP